MKLEGVLEVFPMFIPKTFLERFVFIWGREQCSNMSSQNFPKFLLLFERFEKNVLQLSWIT
jgi:hypothetical protein